MPLLSTRQKGASLGFFTGLGFLWLLAHQDSKHSPLARFKSSFSEGICYGVGGGWGIIWGIGLLARIGLWLDERELRLAQERAKALQEEEQQNGIGLVKADGGIPQVADAAIGIVEVGTPEEGILTATYEPPPTKSETPETIAQNKGGFLPSPAPQAPPKISPTTTEDTQPTGPVVYAQGFVAGALAAVMLTIIASLVLVVFGPLIFCRRLKIWGQHLESLIGIDWDNPEQRHKRQRQTIQGNAIGFGFMMAGAALNWGVEQWDRIVGGEESPHSS